MRFDWKRRAGAYGGVIAIAAALMAVSVGSPAGAQTVEHTFPAVACQANVNGSILTQTQDVTIGIVAPDSVAPGETFTLQFPGGTANLPTQNSGLNITAYTN